MKEKTATVREYNKTGFHIFVREDPSLLDLTIIIISILKKHLKLALQSLYLTSSLIFYHTSE